MPSRPAGKKVESVFWFASLGFAVAVRLWKGLSFPITRDEAWSIHFFVFTPLSNIISRFDPPNNHVLNTLMMKLMALWSLSTGVLRTPALLAGIGYVFAVFFIARKIRSGTGFFFFLAAALHPFLIDFTAISRGYTYGLCFFYLGLGLIGAGLKDDAAGKKRLLKPGTLLGACLLFILSSFSVYSFLLPSLAVVAVVICETLLFKRRITNTIRIFSFVAVPLVISTFLLYSRGLARLIYVEKGVELRDTLRTFSEVASFGTVGSPDKFESLSRALIEFTHQAFLYLPRYDASILDLPAALLPLILFPFAVKKGIRSGDGFSRILILIPAVTFGGAMLSKYLLGTLYPMPRHFIAVLPVYLFVIIEGLDEAARMCGPAVIRKAGGWLLAGLLVISPVRSITNGGFYHFEIDAGFDRILDELIEDAGGEEVSILAIFDDWHFFLLDYYARVRDLTNIRITGSIAEAVYFVQPIQKPQIAERLGLYHEHIYTTRWGQTSLYKIRKKELLLNHPDEF